MSNKKTDMLTVEQYNETDKIKKSNCLGFAIGAQEHIDLEYKGISIEESFAKKVAEYGMTVKRVESLDELRGKTGFIVYGFYDMPMGFGSMTYYEKNDFHIVRVNPDGSLVHKQDDREPAKHVDLLDSRGGIYEYNAPNEPIYLFSLEEERGIDRDAIRERSKTIIERVSKILEDPSVSQSEKEMIRDTVMRFKQRAIENTITSNTINIMLQEISSLVKQRKTGEGQKRRRY